MTAIDKINSGQIFQEIFKAYENKENVYDYYQERFRMIESELFDSNFYKWIALNSKDEGSREVSISYINDASILKQISETDPKEYIRRLAKDKISELSDKIANLSKTVNLFYKIIKNSYGY